MFKYHASGIEYIKVIKMNWVSLLWATCQSIAYAFFCLAPQPWHFPALMLMCLLLISGSLGLCPQREFFFSWQGKTPSCHTQCHLDNIVEQVHKHTANAKVHLMIICLVNGLFFWHIFLEVKPATSSSSVYLVFWYAPSRELHNDAGHGYSQRQIAEAIHPAGWN